MAQSCFVTNQQGVGFIAFRIRIQDLDYPREALTVDSRRVVLTPENRRRVEKEKRMLGQLYEQTAPTPLFSQPFRRPLDSKITSRYGNERVFNGVLPAHHLGTDFRAWTGTRIPVANAGRVVFAGELFFLGNTVVVDHGLGVFTQYGHLSDIKVKVGDRVSQGDIVGLSGSMGRSTATHLHWDVVVNGHLVNGLKFVDNGQFWK